MNLDTRCCIIKHFPSTHTFEKPLFQSTKCCLLEKQRQRGFNPCECRRLELLIDLHGRL